MRKFVLLAVLLILGIKAGSDYLFSEKFQAWADGSKASWTCTFNNFVGRMHVVMSNYEAAYGYLERGARRCPSGATAEVAEFEMALCLEQMARRNEAANAYASFIEKYPNSKKVKVAQRAMQIIRGGL